MYLAERRTRAMGSSAQVLVYANAQAAADRLADLALMRAELLEQCWSRFRDDSELSRLNDNAGLGPVAVSADLETLVAIMREASEWTRGAFDPTILRAIRSLGYDADFAAIVARETLSALDESVSPSLGMCGVVIDTVAHTVSLPAGVGLDPGAIGKGLAGDMITSEIHEAGAEGVLVNLGGDITTRGTAGGPAWVAHVFDDRREGSPVHHAVELDRSQRAVATSSSLRRRWNGRHHIIDPATGRPTESDLAQVTVVAPTGWQAEAATTYALVHGSREAERWLADEGLEAVLFPHEIAREPLRVREALHA